MLITWIIIQGIAIIIVKNMDMLLKIVLGHTSMVTTKGGWVKPHVSVVWTLVTSIDIVQKYQKHHVVNLIKEKARKMLNTSEMRWTRHGKRKKFEVHQMEKGSSN